MGRAGVSWCLVLPNLVVQKSFQRDMERCVQTERSLCGLYISQSPHSIGTHSSSPVCACRLPVFLWFQNTCSYIFYSLVGFLHKRKPGSLFCSSKNESKCSQQPFSAEPLVSDSPVLCWAGCWATVSLLALCPMLRHLSPLACWALPLPRPAAGQQNLKPPLSSPIRHGAPVTQDCLDCSLVSFSLSCL